MTLSHIADLETRYQLADSIAKAVILAGAAWALFLTVTL